jgi:UDP-glucose 4-epimerase
MKIFYNDKKFKDIIIVTGGAGFVGSNLIKKLLDETNYRIISIDNYSSGSKRNHYRNNRVKYLNDNTANFSKIFTKYKKKIKTIFHFGEFSRIYQSFLKLDECINSNSIGSHEVFKFYHLMRLQKQKTLSCWKI